jgi:hypothetical protein
MRSHSDVTAHRLLSAAAAFACVPDHRLTAAQLSSITIRMSEGDSTCDVNLYLHLESADLISASLQQ